MCMTCSRSRSMRRLHRCLDECKNLLPVYEHKQTHHDTADIPTNENQAHCAASSTEATGAVSSRKQKRKHDIRVVVFRMKPTPTPVTIPCINAFLPQWVCSTFGGLRQCHFRALIPDGRAYRSTRNRRRLRRFCTHGKAKGENPYFRVASQFGHERHGYQRTPS